MKIRKLNTQGFAHHFLIALVVVGVACVGTYYVVFSKADTVATNTLATSQQLSAGSSIVSSNHQYQAVMQHDGNFVEYGPSGAIWSSGTRADGADGSIVSMQGDGNLVVYAPGNRAVWSSQTYPSSGNHLVIQNDGNLVIYNSANQALWAKGVVLLKVLASGQTLPSGQSIASPNRQYQVTMQGDGNLVEYGPSGAVWASNTSGNNGATVTMQGDGNLVIYAPGNRAIWSTQTDHYPNAYLSMQDDGNLVVYDGPTHPVWATNGGSNSTGGSGGSAGGGTCPPDVDCRTDGNGATITIQPSNWQKLTDSSIVTDSSRDNVVKINATRNVPDSGAISK